MTERLAHLLGTSRYVGALLARTTVELSQGGELAGSRVLEVHGQRMLELMATIFALVKLCRISHEALEYSEAKLVGSGVPRPPEPLSGVPL